MMKIIIYVFSIFWFCGCSFFEEKWSNDGRILFYTNEIKNQISIDSQHFERITTGEIILSIDLIESIPKIPFDSKICSFNFITGHDSFSEISVDENCKEFRKYTNTYLVRKYIRNDIKNVSYLLLIEDIQADSTFYTKKLFMITQTDDQIKSIILVASDDYTPSQVYKSYTELKSGRYTYYEKYNTTDIVIVNSPTPTELSKASFVITKAGKINRS